jgi:transposase
LEPNTQIYYVDESGIDTHLYREKGRAPRGKKLFANIKGMRFKRKSIVAGKCGHRVVAPLMYDGTMNGALFESWFQDRLITEIEKGAIVIMDNASVHRKTCLHAIAETYGIRLLFQPAYSPDLNKIEHFWAWVKSTLRRILPKYSTLEDALCAAFKIYEESFCPTCQV